MAYYHRNRQDSCYSLWVDSFCIDCTPRNSTKFGTKADISLIFCIQMPVFLMKLNAGLLQYSLDKSQTKPIQLINAKRCQFYLTSV